MIRAAPANIWRLACRKDRMLRVPWPLCGSNTIGKIIYLRLIVMCDHLLSGEPVKISLAAAVQLSVVRSRRRLVTSRARTTFPFASNNGCAAAR
jgi:hypothetical protein